MYKIPDGYSAEIISKYDEGVPTKLFVNGEEKELDRDEILTVNSGDELKLVLDEAAKGDIEIEICKEELSHLKLMKSSFKEK